MGDYRSWATSWDQGRAQVLRIYSTWDQYFVYTTIQYAKGQVWSTSTKKKQGWAGWRLVSEDDKAKFKMKVMGTNGTEEGKGLEEIKKQIEGAAKEVNFSTRTV